jgi:hypothetical protein
MTTFHHHPDGWIYIRGETQTYVDTPENFTLDLGQPYEFTGRERIYEPGVRHFVDNNPQDLEWAEGDTYLEALPKIVQAQAVRLAPIPPSIAQLKLMAIGIINAAFYQAACTLTGEPNLDAIKLRQWDDKFKVAEAWHNAGRAPVTAEAYPAAVAEAANRKDKYADPDKLIASWYVNGLTWNELNRKYWTIYEPAKRAWLRAEERTAEELMAVTVDSLAKEIFTAVAG